MMKFVIFLAVSVMWCGCYILKHGKDCEELKACSLTGNDTEIDPFNKENYENSCLVFENYSSCLKTWIPKCVNGKYSHSIIKSYKIKEIKAGFTCSPVGKEVYRNTIIRECLESKDVELKRGEVDCNNTYEVKEKEATEKHAIHPDEELLNNHTRLAWQDLVTCIRQLYTEKCGEKVGALKAKITESIGKT